MVGGQILVQESPQSLLWFQGTRGAGVPCSPTLRGILNEGCYEVCS